MSANRFLTCSISAVGGGGGAAGPMPAWWMGLLGSGPRKLNTFPTADVGSGTGGGSEAAPEFTPASLADATVGVAYTDTVNVDGPGSKTFEVVAGALPPGFSPPNASGVINGTSTVPGTYSFRLKVTTIYGTDEGWFSIRVLPAAVLEPTPWTQFARAGGR